MKQLAPFACFIALFMSGCFIRGCESSQPPIHPNPNMDYQEKYEPLEASSFFYDGKTMREPVPGTIARGEFRQDDIFFRGVDEAGEPVTINPVEATDAVLARGEERFNIYCTPCHDKRGEGVGVITEYGKIPVPTFYQDRLRNMSDGRMFDVISNGSGLMPGYRYPIPAHDRWAIIRYVRSLQEEQMARAAR